MKISDIEENRIEEKIDDEKFDQDIIALNWALNAEALQQDLYNKLGNRCFDEYSEDGTKYLEVKIAYAKFGPPVLLGTTKNKISYEEFQTIHHYKDDKSNIIQAYPSLYSRSQRKKAIETLDLILRLRKTEQSNTKTFKVSFIFIIYQIGQTELCGLIPIIRVLRKEGDPDDEAWYIDQEDRVYKNWKDFLDDNRLPKMRICYPKNGYYSVNENGYSVFMPEKRVEIMFGMTPASRLTKKILHVIDWTSSGVLIGSLGISVALALSAPISLPVLTGAAVGSGMAALYGATRSGAKLVDRKLHEQTINVTNQEARACWIGMGGTVFALGASSAYVLLQNALALGQTISATTMQTVQGLCTGSLVFSAVEVVNNAHNLGIRLYKGQPISALEVFEFTLSTFLFTNNLMSFNMANTQLSKSDQILTSGQVAEPMSPGLVERLVKQIEKENSINRNSRAIRVLNCIHNPKQFFTKYEELQRQIYQVSGKPLHSSKFYVQNMEIHSSMPSIAETNFYSSMNSLPRTSSEPELSEICSLKSAGMFSTMYKNLRNEIENILLNDYKFLATIHVENNGIENVKNLEAQIWIEFNTINNKRIVYELVRLSINFAKQMGVDNVDDFFCICSCVKNFFECQKTLVLNNLPLIIEIELIDQLRNPDSYLYKALLKHVMKNFVELLNNRNEYRFEGIFQTKLCELHIAIVCIQNASFLDALFACNSYENYINASKSINSTPLKPVDFMKKIDWLFKETELKERILLESVKLAQESYKNKIFHESDGWHGSYFEFESDPQKKIIHEFGLSQDENKILEKFDLLFKK